MSRTRKRLLAVGFVLPVIAVGIGWAFHAVEYTRSVGRAKTDMRVIKSAYEAYFSSHDEWPEKVEFIAPYLECGRSGAPLDPWGQPYVVQLVDATEPDGKVVKRPVVYCQPPDGKPMPQWPENGP